MSFSRVLIVFKKEALNAVRDRRTLYSTILFPLFIMPILVLLPLLFIGQKVKKIEEQPSKICIVNGDRFASLTDCLKASTDFTVMMVEDPQASLRVGSIDCAVNIERGPVGDEPAKVTILFDQTKQESTGAASKVRLAIDQFSKNLTASRLRGLDIDPRILTPIVLKRENIATEKEMGGFIMGMIVGMMAVMGTITGGMLLAIDATAGEKERKTLEVLLASPASRNELVLGKFIAVVTMAIVSVLLMSSGFTVSFSFGMNLLARLGEGGMSLAVSGPVIPLLLLSLLLVAAIVGSVEITISIFARSFREAQSYLTPLTVVVVIPVILMHVIPTHPPNWTFCVPLLNTILLIRELLMGTVNSAHILRTLVSSLIYAVFGLRVAFNIFKKESAIMR